MALLEMGHGYEIVIADGNFSSSSMGSIVINAHEIQRVYTQQYFIIAPA